MSSKFSVRVLCVLALLVVLLAACAGQSTKDKVIGKWGATQDSGGQTISLTFEFKNDGNMTLDVSGTSATFPYTWKDDSTMVIDMSSQAASSQTMKVSFNGEKLVLDDGFGNPNSKLEFTRQ
jgi:hypothetical protein